MEKIIDGKTYELVVGVGCNGCIGSDNYPLCSKFKCKGYYNIWAEKPTDTITYNNQEYTCNIQELIDSGMIQKKETPLERGMILEDSDGRLLTYIDEKILIMSGDWSNHLHGKNWLKGHSGSPFVYTLEDLNRESLFFWTIKQ